MASPRRWTTPSELAEHAFCPRAAWYRREGWVSESPAAEAGLSFHERRLGAELWRDEHAALPWAALAFGILLIALAVTVGLR